MRAKTILLCGLLGACTDPLPPARPTTVRIENLRTASVFINGNTAPFRVTDTAQDISYEAGSATAGTPQWPFGLWAPLCRDCDAVCNATMHGDPAATYLELPAGGSIALAWEGRLYQLSPAGCGCGWGCYEAHPLADASYSFTVPFADALPADRTFSEHRFSGMIVWTGGLGLASFEQSKAFPVDYAGQEEIVLSFR